MAHFAKLDEDNKVIDVVVVHNDELDPENEEETGITFLNQLFGDSHTWKRTSYNTLFGEHALDGTPFRKNYAGIGMYYSEEFDFFHFEKPFPSWTLDPETATWIPPVPRPAPEEGTYKWNEESLSWEPVVL